MRSLWVTFFLLCAGALAFPLGEYPASVRRREITTDAGHTQPNQANMFGDYFRR
ncbi:hypothetical protein DAEQUDRAFT_723829 [Daedalea quercina L-15889]|uniref:Uncharacterized protein n=1 Tax=Daedalea quercina L-15889 TaxID=1314783 RepID=A0A165SAK8_9APHY|nr:hypothetical protein DAEQUDRAFT_723829 [Daedalea quercina L-15889]